MAVRVVVAVGVTRIGNLGMRVVVGRRGGEEGGGVCVVGFGCWEAL
jgi:hypothetical protein